METKKKPNYFLRVITILFAIFIVIYIIGETGYYESKINNEIYLTDEKIKEFEQDIIEGKTIDLKSYVTKESKDYTNALTSLGEGINNGIVVVFTKGLSEIANFFDILF